MPPFDARGYRGAVQSLGNFSDTEAGWKVQSELLKQLVLARLFGPPYAAPRLGRFELVRELGHGSGGSVYEVVDVHSGSTLALKLLRARTSDSIHAFKREFRGLTYIAHPNLVQLHELFFDGDHWYFTMELVRGVRFTRYVRRRGSAAVEPDLTRLRDGLIQLLYAIRAIHFAGRLHCDLKPSNVLIATDGRVVVLDFGLSRPQNPFEIERDVPHAAGTPAYIAPEVLAQRPWTEASDAYSIGVILLEALTGRTSLSERANLVAGRDILDDAPEDLRRVCLGLLDPDPIRRATVDQALEMLHADTGRSPAVSRPPEPRALVGRERELAQLRAAYARARNGGSSAVFVRGCSGIGKSALVSAFAEELRSEAQVLRSACHERESLSYKAFDGLVDALSNTLVRASARERLALLPREIAALLQIFPVLTGCFELPAHEARVLPAPDEARQLAFAALKKLLRGLAQHKPLVLISDDLQWADLDSAQLLLELLAPPSVPGLLYVGCYRREEEPHSEFLREVSTDDFLQSRGAERERVDLEPFDDVQATALALRLLQDCVPMAEHVAARIARESAGIPFFVRELASYHLTSTTADRAAPSLSDLLLRRLNALSNSERRALELLALASRPMPGELVALASGEADACQRSLRALRLHGLVTADAQGRLVPYHDRLRELVVRSLSDPTAEALHRMLALAYEAARAGEPEWLIGHWRAAREPIRALDCALTAATVATNKLAFHRAADLYATALELVPHDDPRRRAFYTARGDALVYAGIGAEAARALLSAAETSPADEAHTLRCRAAQQYLRSGHLSEARDLLKQLFRESGQRFPETRPEVIGMLLVSRARVAAMTRWPALRGRDRSLRTQRTMRALEASFRECIVSSAVLTPLLGTMFYEHALRTGDREAIFLSKAWNTYLMALFGGVRQHAHVNASLTELDADARAFRTPNALALVAFVRGATAYMSGQCALALALVDEARTVFRENCPGTVWEQTFCELVGYFAIEQVGPLSRLCSEAPAVVHHAFERNDRLSRQLLSGHAACGLLVQDRPAAAIECIEERTSWAPTEFGFPQLAAALRYSDAFAYLGDGARALDAFARILPEYVRNGGDQIETLCMMARPRIARAALLANLTRKTPALEQTALDSARLLQRLGRRDASAMAESIYAGIAFQRGKLSDARLHAHRACSLVDGLGLSVVEHCYRLQLGRLSPGTEGARLVDGALESLRALGVAAPERWSALYVSCFGMDM